MDINIHTNRQYYETVHYKTVGGSIPDFGDTLNNIAAAKPEVPVPNRISNSYTENEDVDDNALHGRARVEALISKYGEDSDYSKALKGLVRGVDNWFPQMPEDAKDAWIDLSIDSGVDQISGTSLDGKHSHISQLLAQKAVQDYNIAHGNYQFVENGWGESIESIVNIIKKAIHDIDNPLPGQPEKSGDVKKLVENERNFYVSFLEQMGW